MKACVLNNINDIECKDVVKPVLKKNEVLVKVKACGICSSDIDRVKRTGAYHYPIVLGHEIAGKVEAVENIEHNEFIGKNVVVFPLVPCGCCSACRDGDFALCSNYNYFGSRCDGGFAEYIAVPVWNIMPFSDELLYEVAAIVEPAAVAYHSLSKISNFCSNILVVGTGLIGILIGVFAKNKGYNVTFVSDNLKKKTFLNSLGFERVISSVSEEKFDACFECVGTNESLMTSIRFSKPKGHVVLVGNPKNDVIFEKNIYWKILRQELQISGVWNSVYPSDWAFVLKMIEKLPVDNVITHKFRLEQVQEAFEILSKTSEFKIKGVFVLE